MPRYPKWCFVSKASNAAWWRCMTKASVSSAACFSAATWSSVVRRRNACASSATWHKSYFKTQPMNDDEWGHFFLHVMSITFSYWWDSRLYRFELLHYGHYGPRIFALHSETSPASQVCTTVTSIQVQGIALSSAGFGALYRLYKYGAISNWNT